ncbi:MAG: NADP-dependent oxidoreductase domain containing protein [Clostridia bacterium]|jgi:aryl-alcohol dehydrogenase-like predicted oxidoreductase|nr:NADP-dependent oxidoreductase domain containing protein [Clostridia bacterium]
MNRINLGKSHLRVSQIGLGCVDFGTKIHEKQAFELMNAYVRCGGNFFDTANNYATWNGGDGSESEKTIGRWFEKEGSRDQIILATKLGAKPSNLKGNGFTNMQGLGRKTIIDSVQESIENLKTDYLDLLYLHVDDFSTPQEETMGTLSELMDKGVIKAIGCSNFYTWRIESARQICKKYNYPFFSAIQQRYSYLAPTIDTDFYPQVAADEGLHKYIEYYGDLTLVAYSPLLGGQYNQQQILHEGYDTVFNQRKLKKLLEEEKNPNQWVLKYIIQQFGGSIALLTTASVEHLMEIMND